jgi:hypothetical protein
VKEAKKQLEKVKLSIRYYLQEYEDCERHFLRAKDHWDKLQSEKERLTLELAQKTKGGDMDDMVQK